MAMEHYIGIMSGTSADGVDAVCVAFHDEPRAVTVAAHYYEPYAPDLRQRLLGLMTPGDNEIDRLGALEVELAEIFAAAALSVCRQAGLGPSAITAIGSHGQTVRHRPQGLRAFTLQIGDPARIAERTGIAVVADFRRRDMAAGGQGAPLVPAFHAWLFGQARATRAIVNIGGIANVTLVPGGANDQAVLGFDTGPGNALLDAWIHKQTGAAQDTGGHLAAAGRVHQGLLDRLKADPYFAATPPKSTGREHFSLAWLTERLPDYDLGAADVQATLVRLTAETIAEALAPYQPEAVFVCGGGAENPVLIAALESALATPVATTADLGLDPHMVEPVAFAWLARETLAGRPGSRPTVTGARHPAILGGIYRA